MTSERLYEFWVLSRALNFSRAAEQLFISQSALSKHVAAMERELGVALLARTRHEVRLTDAGQMLARRAQEIIEKCDRAERMLLRGDVSTRGRIRIGCNLELSYAAHIRMFVQQFIARYRDAEVFLDVLPESIPEQLLSGYDLVFSPCNYFNLPGSATKTLVHSHGTYIVLPPGHPLVPRSMISLGQLGGETLIVPYADELFGPYAKNAQLAEHSAREKVHLIPAANLSTALFLVSCGQGLLIGPRYLKNMIPAEAVMINIVDPNCRFDEYLYRMSPDNAMAERFEQEFRENYPI